jgi:hypothetical protein
MLWEIPDHQLSTCSSPLGASPPGACINAFAILEDPLHPPQKAGGSPEEDYSAVSVETSLFRKRFTDLKAPWSVAIALFQDEFLRYRAVDRQFGHRVLALVRLQD